VHRVSKVRFDRPLPRNNSLMYVFVVPEPDSRAHLFEQLESAGVHAHRADEKM